MFGRRTQRGEQERAGEDGGPGAVRGCVGSCGAQHGGHPAGMQGCVEPQGQTGGG